MVSGSVGSVLHVPYSAGVPGSMNYSTVLQIPSDFINLGNDTIFVKFFIRFQRHLLNSLR